MVMIDELKQPPLPNDLLRNSLHFGEFQTEPQAILKDKWPESGMAGREVGFERALADWLIKHRSHWRHSRQPDAQTTKSSTF
jgi:hypothetical protein